MPKETAKEKKMRFNKIGQTILLALSLTAIIVAMSCSGADATKPSKLKGNVTEFFSGTEIMTVNSLSNNMDLTTMSALTNSEGRTVTEIVEVKDTNGNLITVENVLRNNSGGIYQINLPTGTTGAGKIKYKYNRKQAYSTRNGSRDVYFSSYKGSFTKGKGTFNYYLDSIVYNNTTYSGSLTESETNVSITAYGSLTSSAYATVNYSYSSFGDIYASSLTVGTDYTATNDGNTNSIKLNMPTDHAGKNYIVGYTLTNGYSSIYGVKRGIVPIAGSIDITTNAISGMGMKSIDKIYVY